MFTDSEPINDHVSACYSSARLIRFEPEVVRVSRNLNPRLSECGSVSFYGAVPFDVVFRFVSQCLS